MHVHPVRWVWLLLKCFWVMSHRLPGDKLCYLFVLNSIYLWFFFFTHIAIDSLGRLKCYKSLHMCYYYMVKETGPQKHTNIFIVLWQWTFWQYCLYLKSQMEEICLTPKAISSCLQLLIKHFISFVDLLVWNYLLS